MQHNYLPNSASVFALERLIRWAFHKQPLPRPEIVLPLATNLRKPPFNILEAGEHLPICGSNYVKNKAAKISLGKFFPVRNRVPLLYTFNFLC